MITLRAQSAVGAVVSAERLSVDVRVANSVVSYARYLLKMVAPTDLAAFYPMPSSWSAGVVLLAVGVAAALTVLALLSARRRPYLTVG